LSTSNGEDDEESSEQISAKWSDQMKQQNGSGVLFNRPRITKHTPHTLLHGVVKQIAIEKLMADRT
jgi:hypothetical protein